MTQTAQNSYLHRYESKQQSREGKSISKSQDKILPTYNSREEVNTIGTVVEKLTDRVDNIQVKLTNIVNVVKLLQRYTETRDEQYQKEKENQIYKKGFSQQSSSTHCSQIQLKVKEFDMLTKQVKEELKNIQKIKNHLIISEIKMNKDDSAVFNNDNLRELEQNLREQINKKMQICVKLINSNMVNVGDRQGKKTGERMSEIQFTLNQLQNECKRNKMMFDKDIDNLATLIKDNSTALTHNLSRVTANQVHSRSPIKIQQKSKSRNSKSDKSLSRGKQNRSAVVIPLPKETNKIREDELRQALKKKKQHRQKLKVKNW